MRRWPIRFGAVLLLQACARHPFAGAPTGDVDPGHEPADASPERATTPPPSLRAPPTFPLGPGAHQPITADLDGDGRMDVLMQGHDSAGRPVLVTARNGGDGTLGPTVATVLPGELVSDRVPGDFDDDGRADVALIVNGGIASGVSSSSILVLAGLGDGSFVQAGDLGPAAPSSFLLSGLTAGDLDGDGRLDLVTLRGDEILVFRGEAGGRFAPAVASPGPPPRPGVPHAGDFDGDGKADILVHRGTCWAGDCAAQALIFVSNGDGTVHEAWRHSWTTTCPPDFGAMGDFDGDGRLDLLLDTLEGGRLFFGHGDGTLAAPASLTLEDGRPLGLGLVDDLDGDGRLDLVAGGRVLLGRGDGSFRALAPLGGSGGLAALDLDGDGRKDLFMSHGVRGSVWRGLGEGRFLGQMYPAGPYPEPFVATAVATLDLEGDGGADLAIGWSSFADPTGALELRRGDGTGALVSTGRHPLPGRPVDVVTTDLDGDGRPDLAAALGGSAGGLWVFRGRADGALLDPTSRPTCQEPTALVAADLDADADADLVLACAGERHAGSPVLDVLLGRGDARFDTLARLPLGGRPGAVVAGDFDGDAGLDLVVAILPPSPETHGHLAFFGGRGDGSFAARRDLRFDGFPCRLAPADLDGDGRLDLAVARCLVQEYQPGRDSDGDQVQILLGRGDGTFAPPHLAPVPAWTNDLAATDLDGDGCIDLIVAHGLGSGDVSLLRGDCAGGLLAAGTYYGGSWLRRLAVTDLDEDGRPDVVGAYYGGISVLLAGSR